MANNITDDLMNVFGNPKQPSVKDKAYKFNYYDPINELDSVFNVEINYTSYKVAGFGGIIGVTGGEKSRKTTLLAAIVASAISGKEVINFSFDLRGRKVAYIDTEQNEDRFKITQRRLSHIAGIQGNAENYEAWQIRGLTVKERLDLIEQVFKDTPNIGLCVLDGLVDICYDFNNSEHAKATIQKVMEWSDKYNCLIFTVLHLNKDKVNLRGHLGTELQNKCDGIIQCILDEDAGYTTVKCRRSREINFPSFNFTQNKYGYPVLEYEDQTGYEYEETENNTNSPF